MENLLALQYLFVSEDELSQKGGLISDLYDFISKKDLTEKKLFVSDILNETLKQLQYYEEFERERYLERLNSPIAVEDPYLEHKEKVYQLRKNLIVATFKLMDKSTTGRNILETLIKEIQPNINYKDEASALFFIYSLEDFNGKYIIIPEESTPGERDQNEIAFIIETPEMKKAQGMGLIDGQYKWLKGLQLLACFAREMSLRYKLGKGQNANGMPRINWQIFERIFDIQKGKLRQNYNDIQKTGQEPRDIYLVNKLFK